MDRSRRWAFAVAANSIDHAAEGIDLDKLQSLSSQEIPETTDLFSVVNQSIGPKA